MSQYDVFRTASGDLLVDCQAEGLGHLATRFVAPLVPIARAPEARARLNPIFHVIGEKHMLVTQFATAIRCSELRTPIDSLATYRLDIVAAFDMLLTGI